MQTWRKINRSVILMKKKKNNNKKKKKKKTYLRGYIISNKATKSRAQVKITPLLTSTKKCDVVSRCLKLSPIYDIGFPGTKGTNERARCMVSVGEGTGGEEEGNGDSCCCCCSFCGEI
jgi:hypothetical protein